MTKYTAHEIFKILHEGTFDKTFASEEFVKVKELKEYFNPINIPDKYIDEGRKGTLRDGRLFWVRLDYIEYILNEVLSQSRSKGVDEHD